MLHWQGTLTLLKIAYNFYNRGSNKETIFYLSLSISLLLTLEIVSRTEVRDGLHWKKALS